MLLSAVVSSFIFFLFFILLLRAVIVRSLEHVLLPCQYRPGQPFTSRHLNGSITVCLASQHLTMASSQGVGGPESSIVLDMGDSSFGRGFGKFLGFCFFGFVLEF